MLQTGGHTGVTQLSAAFPTGEQEGSRVSGEKSGVRWRGGWGEARWRGGWG